MRIEIQLNTTDAGDREIIDRIFGEPVPISHPENPALAFQGNASAPELPKVPAETALPKVPAEAPAVSESAQDEDPIVEAEAEAEIPVVEDVVLDGAGRPWDKRIHGSGKKMYKSTHDHKVKGCWQYKKSLDEAIRLEVEAELDAVLGASLPQVPAETAAPTAEQIAAAQATVATTVGTTEPATTTDKPVAFQDIMAKVTSSGITQEGIAAVVSLLGLEGSGPAALMSLRNRDKGDAIFQTAIDAIDAYVAG